MSEDTSFEMTKVLALQIKQIKTTGSSIRMVAQRFADMHPELDVSPGHYVDGVSLCQEAAKFLKEDWNNW